MKGQTCDIIFVISDILGIRPIIKQMSVTYVAEAASLLYLYVIFATIRFSLVSLFPFCKVGFIT